MASAAVAFSCEVIDADSKPFDFDSFSIAGFSEGSASIAFDFGVAAVGTFEMKGFDVAVQPSTAIWSQAFDLQYSIGSMAILKRPLVPPPAAARGEATSSSGDDPKWWPAVLRSVERLLALRLGWDSYGAPGISRDVLANALQVLSWAARSSTPAPWVVPTGEGGVQLEWHEHQLDIEVYFTPGEPAVGLFVEDHLEHATSETLILADVKALSDALDRLTARASATAGATP